MLLLGDGPLFFVLGDVAGGGGARYIDPDGVGFAGSVVSMYVLVGTEGEGFTY